MVYIQLHNLRLTDSDLILPYVQCFICADMP